MILVQSNKRLSSISKMHELESNGFIVVVKNLATLIVDVFVR